MHTDSTQTESKHIDQPLSFHKKVLSPEPGILNVIKRNGKVVPYDDSKINVAMTKAFLAVEGQAAAQSDRIHEIVSELQKQISENYSRRHPTGATLHIEEIQDQVELMLMRHGHQKIARAYVLYREEHRKARQAKKEHTPSEKVLNIQWYDGSQPPLDIERMRTIVREACQNLSETESHKIVSDALKNLFDGAHINDVSKALILTSRTLIEKEPQYSFVTARLLLDQLRTEVLRHLDIKDEATSSEMSALYPTYFKAFIQHGIELNMIDPALAQFDLDVIGQAIHAERDLQFTYLGLQTLYDRYFLHDHGTRYEMPQALFMRVAMGLALKEKNKEQAAIEFYNLLSSFDYMSATPTLFNSGTVRPQLSSCFLTTVPDDLEGIYNANT